MNIKRTMVWMVQKPIVFGLVTSSMLVASGIAWSYWSSGTSASSTASGTADTSPTIIVTGALTTGGTKFVPGKSVLYTLQAKSSVDLGTGAKIHLGAVSLLSADADTDACDVQIGDATHDATGAAAAVNATNGFQMTSLTENLDIAADGTNKSIATGTDGNQATIVWTNWTSSQDACKNAVFTFTFATT